MRREELKPMTEKEQQEAIKLLKQAIKQGAIKYTHADPTKECGFDYILYTYEERRVLEKLRANLKAARDELEVLQSIKLISKKDGGDFADLLKNIDKTPAPNISIYASWNYSALCISSSTRHTTTDSEGNPCAFNIYKSVSLYGIEKDSTATELKAEINRRAQEIQEYIEELEKDIKNIKAVSKIISVFNKSIDIFSNTTKYAIKELF